MTVDRGGGVESNHVNDHGHEGAHACQRVNLLRAMINTRSSGHVKRGQKDGWHRPILPIGMGDALG